jgi:predicted nucleic acid-binding protein
MSGQTVVVPGHFDVEVYRTLRMLDRARLLSRGQLDTIVAALHRLSAERVPVDGLLTDAHALGTRFAPGDAFYVALARRIGAPFLTRDGPLARACAGVVETRLL